jgi:PAS domain S-box-containing protein
MPSAIAPEKIDASGLIGSVHRNLGTANESRVAGIAILDEQLRYVEVNEALAGINGLSVEDHLGKTVSEVIPSMAPFVEPVARRILQTGLPELNFELKGEVPGFPGETRNWMVSMVPIEGDDGKPHGVGALVLDVSRKSEASAQIVAHNHLESKDSDEDSGAGKSQSVQLNNRIKILKEVSVALSAAAEVLEHTRSAELFHTLDLENGIDFNDEVRRFEINLIQRALKESAGNQKKAAGLLKLKHTTLHTKIKRYDISTTH